MITIVAFGWKSVTAGDVSLSVNFDRPTSSKMSLLNLAIGRRILNTSASTSWRTMATIAPGATPSASAQASPPLSTDPQSSLRPHHNVQINPDHGLWAFFRKDKFGKPVAMEPAHKSLDFSGMLNPVA